jgi:tRNA-splicing ligase RtcB
MEAVGWAQDFAVENRKTMMHRVAQRAADGVPRLHGHRSGRRVSPQLCDQGAALRLERAGDPKGAVQAREGTMGIIPGSMGVGSFIVRGKGNKDSFCSCSHGAGRTMSRTKAKQMITLDQHARR